MHTVRELAMQLSAADIEGVYETQVCVCLSVCLSVCMSFWCNCITIFGGHVSLVI